MGARFLEFRRELLKKGAIAVAAGAAALVNRAPLAAQTPAPADFKSELLKDWLEMKSTLMKLANEMPEDKYSFKSTPAQRDFGQQVLHIANANVMYLNFLHPKATPPVISRDAKSKAEILKAMSDSFDYGEAAIGEQTPASLFEVIQASRFLGPSSRARVIYFLLGHCWDTYGQMVVYLRLVGGTPPASQRP